MLSAHLIDTRGKREFPALVHTRKTDFPLSLSCVSGNGSVPRPDSGQSQRRQGVPEYLREPASGQNRKNGEDRGDKDPYQDRAGVVFAVDVDVL